MMKKINIVYIAVLSGLSFVVSASADDKLAGMPTDSTSNAPTMYSSSGMPKACKNAAAEKIIKDYESGALKFANLPKDDTVKTGWETWDGKGGIKNCPGGAVNKTGDYCWKWISRPTDGRTPMGVSVRFGPYDNTPHYHKQAECFYVLKGESMMNVQGGMEPYKKGEIVHIEGNAIHDMAIVKPEPFAHFWWYPNDTDWDSFEYHWRKTTLRNPEIQAAFDRVDRMRTDAGMAPKGAVPVSEWWEANK